MKLYNKIRAMRKAKNLTILDLHKKLMDAFGKKALAYNSLARIEQGKTKPQVNSLLQICVGLGINIRELKEDIEEESALVNVVKKNKRTDRYTYNEKTYAEMLTPMKRGFLCTELVINPGGKTILEQDPIGERKFEKWIYCLKGSCACHIGQEVHILKRGDCLSFESTLPHYFENNTDKNSSCIIVQNPRHI